ncbi:uncharacterized protein DC041_0003368 [Schistosoma bovis]|uniref:Calponin-homology (CH) domain-containing protein n=1 Tax=Schistosoma bovis TaxID=6184 RepID=A0A430QKE5_SCHBO|nr:uncharacterized protein DC041_0003368 [Schistosoma bovis]
MDEWKKLECKFLLEISFEMSTSQSTEEAYIKWLNDHLTKATPPLIVYDLTEEIICNGVAIGILLEIIGRIKIDGLLLQPITTVERLHNIHEVFSVLRRLNVKINNIQPEDIMEGDKDTVLELLIAINDYFLPKPNMKTPKKFNANNHNNYDIDYKMESNGRTSAWSTISSSTRRTPINRSETVPQLNGHHENGIFSTNNHHSHKNLLHHSTNGIDYPTIDLPWSNSIDHFTDNNNNSRQPYSSYHQSLAPTPTPSELTNSTSPRSKSTVYRVRSEPLSPRSIHGMGNSNHRFHTLKQYNNTIDITTTTTTTTNYKSIPLINNKINNQQTSINQYHDNNNNNNNSLINDNKKIDHKQNDHDLDLDLDHDLNVNLDQIELDLTINNSLNRINYELLHKNDSFINNNNNNNNESLIHHYSPNRYNHVDKADHYALHSNKTNQFNLMKNKKYKKKLNLLKKIQKFYFYCIHHLMKLNYHRIIETNESIEASLSTAPINIRSALPNLNSGSRGYYHQTNPSQSIPSNNYSDSRNGNTIRSGRSTNELPQIVDSMNEVQQLRSQLNMLSKLIESDGSNPVRTASVLRQTAAKSTEENSRLSDSLKTFLYNMNKPGNLDKTTMSTNNYSIKSHEYQDLLDNNNKQRLSNNPMNTSRPHPPHHQGQQQQAEHQHDYTPRHHHHSPQSHQRDHHHSNYNPSKHTFNQPYNHLNSSNTSTPINTPMIISPSHLSMIKPDNYDRTISPRSMSPYKLDHSKNQLISPSSLSLSPTNSDRIKNIKRQLSPTGKRFPYYQPYIHSLMHSNELNKVDKHKCFNESKTLSHGLTTAQAQLIKSPTQRLLMQKKEKKQTLMTIFFIEIKQEIYFSLLYSYERDDEDDGIFTIDSLEYLLNECLMLTWDSSSVLIIHHYFGLK